MKRLDVDVSAVPELVAACCVLHSICELRGDVFNEELLNEIEMESLESIQCNTSSAPPSQSAIDIRNTFMSHFSQWSSLWLQPPTFNITVTCMYVLSS